MKKISYIIIPIVLVLLVIGGYFIFKDNKDLGETDAQKFAKEYTEVAEDNVYVYRTAEEIIRIMEKGTGVVYLGFPECPWCQTYAKYLNEVAKEVGIDKIYYYDILEDRQNNTEDYQAMVNVIKDHLQNDAEGNPRVYVPNVSFHIEGKVIGNDCETSLDTKGFEKPVDYWTAEEVADLKKTLKAYMEDIYAALNVCTNCNK